MSGFFKKSSLKLGSCKIHVKKDQEKEKTSKPMTSSKSTASLRNPLSTLSDNIPLPQSGLQRASTFRKSTTSVENINKKNYGHSRSTSEIETKFCSPLLEKVTVRNKRDNTENLKDEVFVDGEKHYLNYLSGNKETERLHKQTQCQEQEQEIMPLPVVRVSGGFDKFTKKPARKVTLVRKRHSSCYKIENFYQDCMFSDEYFMDNYKHMLRTEGNFVFRRSYLTKYTNYSLRLLIVNWLVYIQQVLELSETTLFTTIRMLDHMSIKLKISDDKYGLVAIVCLWIVSKVYDSRPLLVPKLFVLCNGKYSRNQIISTEKEILKVVEFELNYPDPLPFLYYYLREEKLEKDSKVRYSAMFLLELFTFMLEFSSSAPSLLVAAAVYMVCLKYEIQCENFLKFISGHLIEETIFKHFTSQVSECVKEILNCKCFHNEVVAKYSVQEKLNVAQLFVSN